LHIPVTSTFRNYTTPIEVDLYSWLLWGYGWVWRLGSRWFWHLLKSNQV